MSERTDDRGRQVSGSVEEWEEKARIVRVWRDGFGALLLLIVVLGLLGYRFASTKVKETIDEEVRITASLTARVGYDAGYADATAGKSPEPQRVHTALDAMPEGGAKGVGLLGAGQAYALGYRDGKEGKPPTASTAEVLVRFRELNGQIEQKTPLPAAHPATPALPVATPHQVAEWRVLLLTFRMGDEKPVATPLVLIAPDGRGFDIPEGQREFFAGLSDGERCDLPDSWRLWTADGQQTWSKLTLVPGQLTEELLTGDARKTADAQLRKLLSAQFPGRTFTDQDLARVPIYGGQKVIRIYAPVAP